MTEQTCVLCDGPLPCLTHSQFPRGAAQSSPIAGHHKPEVFLFYRCKHLHHIHTDRKVFEEWMEKKPYQYPPTECEIVRYVPESHAQSGQMSVGDVQEQFNVWWDANQACPEHGMITRNAALAAWHAAYDRYVRSPGAKVSEPWTCCHCDAPLSCGACGVEQPNDSEYYRNLKTERDLLVRQVEQMKVALEKAGKYARQNHKANGGWWNDPQAYYFIEKVIKPALSSTNCGDAK